MANEIAMTRIADSLATIAHAYHDLVYAQIAALERQGRLHDELRQRAAEIEVNQKAEHDAIMEMVRLATTEPRGGNENGGTLQ
jgi:type II secretory pathway component PulF